MVESKNSNEELFPWFGSTRLFAGTTKELLRRAQLERAGHNKDRRVWYGTYILSAFVGAVILLPAGLFVDVTVLPAVKFGEAVYNASVKRRVKVSS